ncbi:hypothetical protein IAU59_002218 [Kwoniella sp. CBS 9459]
MRIHLPLHASQFAAPVAAAGPSSSSSPLVTLGGDLVLIELQGELNYEGDHADGVIGVIGLDRPDKPTLHLGAHHLLHGKFVNLQKPYAVIRRVVASTSTGELSGTAALEGDAIEEDRDEDEDDDEGDHDEEDEEEDEDEDDGRLFEPNPDIDLLPTTPRKRRRVAGGGTMSMTTTIPSSSPMSSIATPRTPLDYSSELDMSSPARFEESELDSTDDDGDSSGEQSSKRKKSKLNKNGATGPLPKKKNKNGRTVEKKGKKTGESILDSGAGTVDRSRTRHYEVVGVVRKKVVFALRPEPLVAPTILPE